MKATVFLSLVLSLPALAQNHLVVGLRGNATFDGKPVQKGEQLPHGGVLTVGEKSWVKMRAVPGDDQIMLAAGSSVRLSAGTPPQLEGGMLRWVTGQARKAAKDGSVPPVVRTPNAVMGVRGTDFLVVSTPLLGESEIICFDGLVDFGADSKGGVAVKAGQWGGLGGRFTAAQGQRIDLPANVLEHFNGALPRN